MKQKLDENFVAENVQKILEGLAVSATVEVSMQENIFFVDISSPDSALLIGKYGINLESLQFILAVRLKTQTARDDFEIFIDIGGWRKQREEHLRQMVLSIASQVSASQKAQSLYNLRSSERRLIHMTLADHPKVTTISEGDSSERHLIIQPR